MAIKQNDNIDEVMLLTIVYTNQIAKPSEAAITKTYNETAVIMIFTKSSES